MFILECTIGKHDMDLMVTLSKAVKWLRMSVCMEEETQTKEAGGPKKQYFTKTDELEEPHSKKTRN